MFTRRGRATPSLRRARFILPLWIVCIIWMLTWWLQLDHIATLWLYIPLTAALLYEFIFLPSVFLYFVFQAKFPKKRVAPKSLKVAVISLCVPKSESIDIVEKQLRSMTEITYPHDSWILDEGRSSEIKQLARKYGVKYFTRKGIRKYNQPGPPFQKKTKAGNVNAWLEHVKRRKYDFFVQLDIDHLPKPNYLNKTLGYFRDTDIAWVQAPSVYGNREHWIARGAAEQELVLQGPLQMGFYGFSTTPFIIGSHCTYRMSAIREIGGFQPTRAEDHLDTVHLANRGYKGIFLPEVIAEGDGPETLSVYLAQQFAWAYSMFQVLLHHSPQLLKGMPYKRVLQFLFAQTWYPLWSLSYLILFFSPVVALLINQDVVQTDRSDVFAYFGPLFVCTFLVWWSARPLMQPKGLHLSWRGMILHAVRWPVILRAIFSATLKIKKPYMITPKGKFARTAPQLKTYRPFITLSLICCVALLVSGLLLRPGMPTGQVVFVMANAGFMMSICALDISLRYQSTKPAKKELRLYWLKPITATAALAMLFVTSLAAAPFITSNASLLAEEAPARHVSQSYIYRPALYTMSTTELVEHLKHANKRSASDTPHIGIYNQVKVNEAAKQAYIQHSFVDWRDSHYLAYVLAETAQNGNVPLITIEPRGYESGAELLASINEGHEDARLEELASVVAQSKHPVYIRFAHEMELQNLYPWGNQDPTLFIQSYQHTADLFKNKAPLTKFVWSPAGNLGAEAYYPGDAYVDVIGTTMLYDQYWYGGFTPSFEQIQTVRNWLLSYNKPVWIVEFGSGKANVSQQKAVIDDALNSFRAYGYHALIYLNMKDSNLEGPDYRLANVNDFAGLFTPVIKAQATPQPSVKVTPKPAMPKQPKCPYINPFASSSLSLSLQQNPLRPVRQTPNCT